MTTEVNCEKDELPIVSVTGKAIGGHRELVASDMPGELVRTVFGKWRSSRGASDRCESA